MPRRTLANSCGVGENRDEEEHVGTSPCLPRLTVSTTTTASTTARLSQSSASPLASDETPSEYDEKGEQQDCDTDPEERRRSVEISPAPRRVLSHRPLRAPRLRLRPFLTAHEQASVRASILIRAPRRLRSWARARQLCSPCNSGWRPLVAAVGASGKNCRRERRTSTSSFPPLLPHSDQQLGYEVCEEPETRVHTAIGCLAIAALRARVVPAHVEKHRLDLVKPILGDTLPTFAHACIGTRRVAGASIALTVIRS